jgi:hypothetical protein
MKDIICIILFFLIWNTPIHTEHPNLVPVLLTLYVVILALEIVLVFLKRRS